MRPCAREEAWTWSQEEGVDGHCKAVRYREDVIASRKGERM